jgi:hypothetical protein
MLQAAYETLGAFEEAIRAGARGDLSEEGRDAARTAMGNVLDEMAEALYRERERVAALQSRIDWTFEALDAYQRGRQGTGEEIAEDDIIDVAIALLMDGDDVDAPGQPDEEGQGQ